MKTNIGKRIFALLPVFILIIIFYIPLTTILFRGFNKNFINDFFNSFYYRRILSFTLFQALLSALLSVVIALPGAYLITKYNFIGKKLFLSLTTLPFVLPSILTVLGFVLLFGNSGIINNLLKSLFNLDKPPLKILYSLKAVLLAHIFYNFPLAIRIISSRWKKIPEELSEASRSLGIGRFMTFVKANLPYLSSGILTSFVLIFLYCFMSFGIILVLGGGPKLSTLEVEVYRFARISLNIPKAASLAIVESFFTIIVLLIYLGSERKDYSFPGGRIILRKLNLKMKLIYTIYLVPLFLILVAPLLTIAVNSFLKQVGFTENISLSLYWYKSIFGGLTNSFNGTALKAIKNSLVIGFFTVLLSLPLSTLITYNINSIKKYKGFYTLLFFIPMGVSSIIIGLSYINMQIPGSYLLIIIAHTVMTLPLSIRSINVVFKTLDKSLIEASLSLGINRFYTFLKIELPIIKSGLITAAVFTFSLSIGEMNASIMLAPNNFVTIPLAIYQLIGSYNYYGACALGTILLIICLFSFRLIDKMDE